VYPRNGASNNGGIKKSRGIADSTGGFNKLSELSKQFYTNHQALIFQQCPRAQPYFADAVEDNFPAKKYFKPRKWC